jgi:hypothetical protein
MIRRSRSLTGRRLFQSLLAAALLVGLLVLPAVSAAAGTGMGFAAQPLPGSPGAELGYFKFEAAPGETVRRVLQVVNTSGKAEKLRVAANDGRASVYGGVDYTDIGARPSAVGAWISVSRSTLKLAPGATAAVPFNVVVPAGATSGEHVGGLSIWEPAAATTSSGSAASSGTKQAATRIIYVQRRVLAVEVVTPGPSVPEVVISGVKATPRADGMYLSVAISNDGTAITTGEGTLSLPQGGFNDRFSLDSMIPTARTEYPVKWERQPAEGTYPATVEIRYANDTKVATWSGDVTVGSDDAKRLGERLIGPASTAAQTKTPWLMYGLIGGLVVVVLVMAIALLRRRRPA